MTDQQQKVADFRKLAMPLINYMYENWHPHAKAVITADGAEVSEGVLSSGIVTSGELRDFRIENGLEKPVN